MTLVVARIYSDGPRIICDSKLTRPSAHGYLTGALKAIILNPNLCICYAGNSELAIDAIVQLSKMTHERLQIDNIKQQLLEVHRINNHCVDFIITTLKPPALFKVALDTVSEHHITCSIGHHGALEAFQKYRSNEPTINHPIYGEYVASRNALMKVIDDIGVRSVDELLVSVVPGHGGLQYAPSTAMYMGRDQPIPDREWTTLNFGGAAEGGFAYSILTPEEPGIGAIGVHFFQGRLGVLFHPLKFREPEKYTNVTHEQFREEVQRRHSISIEGATIS